MAYQISGIVIAVETFEPARVNIDVESLSHEDHEDSQAEDSEHDELDRLADVCYAARRCYCVISGAHCMTCLED